MTTQDGNMIKFWHLTIFVIVCSLMTATGLLAQDAPRYDFIGFGVGYDRMLSEARNMEYAVKEEEIKAPYGTHYVLLQKDMQFYGEHIALFFNENKELIFFSVSYELKENHSQTVIEKLVLSIGDRLIEKYGPNEVATAPYYRIYENNYEVFLYPTGPAPEVATLSFKQLDLYSAYQEYYKQEVERLENEEIAETVEKL
jgi:hypothetical protein